MAEFSDRNITGLVEQEEVSSPNIHIEESMPTEWTNEKHRSYLNSMEAMFVKQLYNDGYNAMDSLGWRSRRKNPVNPSSSGQSNANTHTSGQFKVLQSVFWKKINLAETQHGSSTANESRVFLENPKNPQNHGRHSKGSMKSPSLQSDSSQLNYKEVSDQNFAEEDNEPVQINNLSRKKRTKAKMASATSKDQVVPIGKSPVTRTPNKCYEEKRYGLKQQEKEDQ